MNRFEETGSSELGAVDKLRLEPTSRRLGSASLYAVGEYETLNKSLSDEDLYDLISYFVQDNADMPFTLDALRREVPLEGVNTRWILDCLTDIADERKPDHPYEQWRVYIDEENNGQTYLSLMTRLPHVQDHDRDSGEPMTEAEKRAASQAIQNFKQSHVDGEAFFLDAIYTLPETVGKRRDEVLGLYVAAGRAEYVHHEADDFFAEAEKDTVQSPEPGLQEIVPELENDDSLREEMARFIDQQLTHTFTTADLYAASESADSSHVLDVFMKVVQEMNLDIGFGDNGEMFFKDHFVNMEETPAIEVPEPVQLQPVTTEVVGADKEPEIDAGVWQFIGTLLHGQDFIAARVLRTNLTTAFGMSDVEVDSALRQLCDEKHLSKLSRKGSVFYAHFSEEYSIKTTKPVNERPERNAPDHPGIEEILNVAMDMIQHPMARAGASIDARQLRQVIEERTGRKTPLESARSAILFLIDNGILSPDIGRAGPRNQKGGAVLGRVPPLQLRQQLTDETYRTDLINQAVAMHQER